MSIYIHKSHNVNVLLYHLVFPTKYRKVVIDNKVDLLIKNVCEQIALRYEIHFVEIGTDLDHVHFLIQSVPMMTITKIVTIVKSITAREVMKSIPEVKRIMWSSNLWTSGYFVMTVGKHGSEDAVKRYVKEQGKLEEYSILIKNQLKFL